MRIARLLVVGILLRHTVVGALPGPVGSELQVNTYTTGDQRHPAVAGDAAGNFVVVWDSVADGDSLGVFGQRYDSSGLPVGSWRLPGR